MGSFAESSRGCSGSDIGSHFNGILLPTWYTWYTTLAKYLDTQENLAEKIEVRQGRLTA